MQLCLQALTNFQAIQNSIRGREEFEIEGIWDGKSLLCIEFYNGRRYYFMLFCCTSLLELTLQRYFKKAT